MRLAYALAIGLAFQLLCVGIFVARRGHEPVASRGWAMSMLVAAAGLAHYVIVCIAHLSETPAGETKTCTRAVNYSTMLWLPAVFLPIIIRCYTLFYRFDYHDACLRGGPNPWHVRLRWTSKAPYQFLYYAAVLGFWAAIAHLSLSKVESDDIVSWERVASPCTFAMMPALVSQVVISVILVALLWWALWRASDFFAIKAELLMLSAVDLPLAVVWLLDSALGWTPFPYLFELIFVVFTCGVVLLLPAVLSFVHRYAPAHRLAAPLDDLSSAASGRSCLVEAVLDTPSLAAAFQRHLVDTWRSELLMFYIAARDFGAMSLSDDLGRMRVLDEIVQLYVAVEAPQEINIDGPARQRILRAQREGRTDDGVFDEALGDVVEMLERDCMRLWMRTASFETALARAGMSREQFKARVSAW